MLWALGILLANVVIWGGLFLIWRRSHPKPIGMLQVIDFLWAGDGWVVLANDQYRPMFQGKLLYVTEDCLGLAVGVVLEENCPPQLIKDMKAARTISYLEAGKILARVIFDLHSDSIFTHLTDVRLRGLLEHYAKAEAGIDVKLVMSSAEIALVNSREDEQEFARIWNMAEVQPGQASAGSDCDQ